MAIKIFEGLEFLNESLVLIFKHSHTIFKTFDIFFLLPATLPGSFPRTNTRQMTTRKPPSTIQSGSVNICPPSPQSTANWSEDRYTKPYNNWTKHVPCVERENNWRTLVVLPKWCHSKNDPLRSINNNQRTTHPAEALLRHLQILTTLSANFWLSKGTHTHHNEKISFDENDYKNPMKSQVTILNSYMLQD